MSDEFFVEIDFSEIEITKDFFVKLDQCFSEIGFHKAISCQGTSQMNNSNESQYYPKVELDRRFDFFSDVSYASIGTAYGCNSLIKLIFLSFSYSQKKIYSLSINANGIRKFDCFNDWEMDMVYRIEAVSENIHKKFNAKETKGKFISKGDKYENWFHFSLGKYKKIPNLESKKGHSQIINDYRYFISWARDEEEILNFDSEDLTFKKEDYKASFPLEYDNEFGEFHIVYEDQNGDRRISLLRNDLVERAISLPISERENNFYYPTEEQIAKFRKIAWRSKGIDGLEQQLGKPDMKLRPVLFEAEMKEANSARFSDVVNQICYTNISDTSVVIFREYEDGIITVIYAGKEKE